MGYYYNPRYTATESNQCWIATTNDGSTSEEACPEGFTLVTGGTDIGSGNKLEFDGKCLSTSMTGCYIKKTKNESEMIGKYIFVKF